MPDDAPTRDGDPARPAPVVPRGRRLDGTAGVPLDRLVLPLITAGTTGTICVVALPGGGKTTAARHLRAVLPVGTPVLDRNDPPPDAPPRSPVVQFAVFADPTAIANFALTDWGRDDWMEYLVAVHRGACGSVLARLAADPSAGLLGGSPALAVLVLDAMAADPALTTARDAVRRHAWAVIPPGHRLDRLMTEGQAGAPLDADLWRWWRHAAWRRVATADWVAAQLAGGRVPPQFQDARAGAELIPEVAAAVRLRPAAVDCLRRFLAAGPAAVEAPMAAGVLLAVDPGWRPADGRKMNLCDARLAGARWPGIDLSGALLTAADLTGADLSGANLAGARAGFADLTGANLRRAHLDDARLAGALLRSADLSTASAARADFSEAVLAGADLRHASVRGAAFHQADLTGARAAGADFSAATVAAVRWAGADFTAAIFAGARAQDVDFTPATWAGASFARAALVRCNFEGVRLPDADFRGADLTGSLFTGSHVPGGQFRGAKMSQAGLADVDWPGADLRGVDFAGASFHLGSTRSGLVGSLTPGEGSRTGFYTDDYNDQSYRPAEDIRKANLSGATLTGAAVDGTDFYLVDLRRAVYSKAQGEHFAKTGAILRTPTAD